MVGEWQGGADRLPGLERRMRRAAHVTERAIGADTQHITGTGINGFRVPAYDSRRQRRRVPRRWLSWDD